MDKQAFKAWRERVGLSLTEAGHALGVDRTQVIRYQNGSIEKIPQPIQRLCVYIEKYGVL